MDRVAELGSRRNAFQQSPVEKWLHHAGTEIAAAPIEQQILECQWTQIQADHRADTLRQGRVVLTVEVLTPVDINIRGVSMRAAYHDELLFKQLLDLHLRAIFRLVDQGGVDGALFQ